MNVAVIQARMGSSRLPGKMMLPLAGRPAILRVVDRVAAAESIDRVVIATTDHVQDDIIEQYVETTGATVFRGSEEDVLGRMYDAAAQYDPETVVRIAGDRPIVPVGCLDAVVEAVEQPGVEYAANVLERSFPRGYEAEAFSFDSFTEVADTADDPYEREHVTPYYREHPEQFGAVNVDSESVFDDPTAHDRTELRLTLDEAADYELLETIYDGVAFEDVLPAEDAITHLDRHDLGEINEHISQEQWREDDS